MLGPLTVHDTDGRPVKVTRAAVRVLLADLLAGDGAPVSADRLVEDLWGAAPPRDPAAALQVRVAQLRSALGDRTLVESTSAGYRLLAGDVDAAEFTALTKQAGATTEPARKVALLDRALALWRGPAYADFTDAPFAQAAITRLTEQRLVAVEDRLEALDEWDLGELAELVATHPLRERVRAVRLAAEHSYEPGTIHAELGLALGARREGKLDLAEKHLHHVLDWQRDADYVPGDAFVLAELGFVAEQQGNAGKALDLHTRSLTEAEKVGDQRAIALALEGLAGAHSTNGNPVRAAELLGAATAAREATGAPLPAAERLDVNRITEKIRQSLDAESFTKAFTHGRTQPPIFSRTKSASSSW